MYCLTSLLQQYNKLFCFQLIESATKFSSPLCVDVNIFPDMTFRNFWLWDLSMVDYYCVDIWVKGVCSLWIIKHGVHTYSIECNVHIQYFGVWMIPIFFFLVILFSVIAHLNMRHSYNGLCPARCPLYMWHRVLQ